MNPIMMQEIPRRPLPSTFIAVLLGLAVLGFGSSARCQDTGKHDFDTICASCHGIDGTGKGRDLTEANPPDLTQLSRNNGGKFPFEEVYRIVDGREMKASHGRFAMPFWGDYLQKQGQEYTPGSNAAVKQRISAIVRYVERLQKK
jgi:mono/diheme cytochrome c family protein